MFYFYKCLSAEVGQISGKNLNEMNFEIPLLIINKAD